MKKKVRAPSQSTDAPAPDGTRRLGESARYRNAQELWSAFNDAQSKRDESNWAKIVHQYDRLPYKDDEGEMIPNFGSMRFKVDQAITTYVDYATERERWAAIKTVEGEIGGNSALWSEHISTAFHKHCISNWPDKFAEIILSVRDMLMFVRGSLMWGGNSDWDDIVPHSVDISHVIPDANAGMFPKDFDTLFVKKRYSAVELWRKVRNPAIAKKNGWRKSEVMSILKHSMTSLKDYTHDEIFAKFGSNQMSQPDRDFMIDTVCAYVSEYDKEEGGPSISHYIIPATVVQPKSLGVKTQEESRNKSGFLCHRERYYESMNQVISIVASVVTRSFHEGKSYAELIYLTSKTYDLVTYRVLQAIEDNMRIYIESANQEQFAKLKKMRHKQYNLLAPGVKIIQERVVRPVQEAMQVLRTMMSDERAGTGQYEIGGSDIKGGAKTAKQSEIDLGESLKISGSELKMFNAYMTNMMDEVYRRWTTQEKPIEVTGRHPYRAFERFKAYLKSKNVPDAAWAYENVQVSSLISLGAGSPAARLQAARVTMEALAVPASGPGERRAQRDMVGAVQGVDNVDGYIPQDDQLAIPEDTVIGLENDVLSDPLSRPQNTPVLPHQMHMRHIASHVADAEQSIKAAAGLFQGRAQMPAVDDGIILKTIQDILIGVDHKLAHSAAHIQLAKKSKDKKRLALIDQIGFKIAGLNKQQDQLENMVIEAQKPRAQMAVQPQADPEADHTRVMYSLKEEHEAKMLAFDANKAISKAEQLREQSAANTQHKQGLETFKTVEEIKRQAALDIAKARQQMKKKENEPDSKKK